MGQITELVRLIPADPGKPARKEAAASRRMSLDLALHPSTWSAEQADETVRRYTELAPVWDDERGGYRPVPLADALERGGPWPQGLCLEVGCGTGLLSGLLHGVWSEVISLDLTWAMLSRSTEPWRIVGDASRLPVATASARAVVLADVPLFADEVVRTLAPDGVLVWSNALGEDAPHHVPIPTVLAALESVSGESWSAVTSHAGWGLWAVLRRNG
ncbi:methyltransferase domain-containing protein [Kribbella sp. VKM Ac-2566]|uniref:methyltransferase domain-containing protein n=1 Tax=Kribbella sp. VKM Ac-2566 TaxID=2512218 RepID=UPI0010E6C8D8|nr:methyltransferase domain-containing protein [Kribbella sp. VKM Ac-2566]TDW92690.1 methyltransferase family protein [Kribbella sp. VKM Ac-2566]